MFAGGEEGVLVVWQLATAHRRFLPRIGGKLLSIRMSENALLYGIATQDNAIRIFDSVSLETVRVLSGIAQGLSLIILWSLEHKSILSSERRAI